MWDTRFMRIAEEVASWSKCNRLKVGAVLVKDKRIFATGYNGLRSGEEGECECEGVTRDQVIHAETNVLLQCAKHGIRAEGCTLYITHHPCQRCLVNILQAGITEIIYKHDYGAMSPSKLIRKI